MSQSTLDEDELFGEAANEVRDDVESSLAEAAAALPEADDVWNVDANNTLGALNSLRSALDSGDAEAHLRDAKKWYTMGKRADAFDDADDLEAEIGRLEDAIADIDEAKAQVGDLTSTVPGLKNTLEDLQTDADEADDGDETEAADGEETGVDSEIDEEDADETDADEEDTEAAEV